MAEFSKEYNEATGFGIEDFSYTELFEDLPKEHYISQICEGFGTIAVMRNEKDEMLLAYPISEEDVEWITLEETIKRTNRRNQQ